MRPYHTQTQRIMKLSKNKIIIFFKVLLPLTSWPALICVGFENSPLYIQRKELYRKTVPFFPGHWWVELSLFTVLRLTGASTLQTHSIIIGLITWWSIRNLHLLWSAQAGSTANNGRGLATWFVFFNDNRSQGLTHFKQALYNWPTTSSPGANT